MARIELVDLAHAYDGESAPGAWALKELNLIWEDGGAYALLGPSGCGKTTLLNIISGLMTPTQGRVLFDGRDVTALAPQERNIAQVFQFPVIYDTMTVFDNLAFPLRNRGMPEAQVRRRVGEVAEILELQTELPRRAKGLSADAKQKVSLGRGLVRSDVAAVLFDEPLTVIDPHVKWLLRRKLKQIHQQLKLSLIYVTHDQTEALTFADRVVVMAAGEVMQVGTPQELFETPAHQFVGHFIGTPGMNFLSCDWLDTARIGGTPVFTTSSTTPTQTSSLAIGIRPDYVELCDASGPNRIPVEVLAVHDQGTHLMIQLQMGSQRAWSKLRNTRWSPTPSAAFAYLPPEKCALYVAERRLA